MGFFCFFRFSAGRTEPISHPTAARRILNWLDGILAKMGSQKAQERAAEREFLETARSFYQRGLAEVNAAGNVNGQTSAENVNIPGQESGPAVENITNERTESANERTARDAGVVQDVAKDTGMDSDSAKNGAERTSAENARQETERVYQEKIKQLENVTTMEEAKRLIAELNETRSGVSAFRSRTFPSICRAPSASPA